MSHPFGDLLSQHLHRKHGLSQARLAAGILQDPSIIGKMCKGQRLSGPQARERVLAIIGWLHEQTALTTVAEANALLEAAGMAPLRGGEAVEAALLRQLGTQPATHHRSRQVMAPPFPAREEEVTGEPRSTTLELMAHPRNGDLERLHPGVSQLARLSAGYSIPARPKHNLPAQTTPLIGREQELTQLADLLADPATRLVTILSAGGMGKSHLAVAAALSQVEQFADGVCWVALAPLTETNEIVFAIAAALGIQLEGERTPEHQVCEFLQAKDLLLVLDNFEHLLEGAPLVGELLAKAPQLSILVTSRQRLKLSSETVVLLDGLPFPTDKNAEALAYPAVQLFLQHARRVCPRYQPDEPDVAGIVQICHLVDGMPLGILLAAAWTGVISPPEIAAEIGNDLGFLQSDLHDIPARQRNLRAVFLHTWNHLSTAERTVFMRLSVFRGGATREAAQRVTGATIAVLAALTDKALLWRLPNGRLELHELLRQFAAEQLAADDASQGGRQRQAHLAHSRYYLTLLGEQEAPLQGQHQRTAVDLIRADFENMSIAWRWAVQQREFALLAPAIHPLFLYCEVRGIYHEGVLLFANAAEVSSSAPSSVTDQPIPQPLLGQVLVRLGACEVKVDRHMSAENHLQRGMRYGTHDRERAFALAHLGSSAVERGELSMGREMLHESLALSRQIGDRSGMAEALFLRNWCFPEPIDALRNCEESLTLWREVGRPDRIAAVLSMVAWHTCCLGDYEKAIAYWQETLEICTTLDMQHTTAFTLDNLGWVAWCQGDLASAQSYLQAAIDLSRTLGMPTNVSMSLSELALVLRSAGKVEQAVTLAYQAVAIVRDTDNEMRLILNLIQLGAVLIGAGEAAAARRALIEAIPQAVMAHHTFLTIALYYFAELLVLESHRANLSDPLEHRALAITLLSCVCTQTGTWQIFRDKAAQLQAEIESMLPAETFCAAVQRGKSCTLQEMANALLGDEPDARLDDAKQAP